MAQDDPDATHGPIQAAGARAMIQARPADPIAWLRLAFADRQIHGKLTTQGLDALDKSYSLAPYAAAQGRVRVVFALDNWDDLPPRTRKDVLNELDIIKSDRDTTWKLFLISPAIHNPNGRMIAVLEHVLRPGLRGIPQ